MSVCLSEGTLCASHSDCDKVSKNDFAMSVGMLCACITGIKGLKCMSVCLRECSVHAIQVGIK
jgi:hypothetical protein